MDGEDIVMQLVAKLEPNEYMSFGLSKNDSASQMVNADAIVAWIDRNRRGYVVDYFLGSKEQCVGQRGSCPDVRHPDGTDSAKLLNAATVNGYTMITFKRPQVGLDEKYDQHVYSDGPQAIVWAIGPLNNRDEVSYHGIVRSEGDVFIDFARPPQWNCPQPENPTAQTTTTPRPIIATTITKKPIRKPSSTTRSRTSKPKTSTANHDRRRKPYAAPSQTSSSRVSSTKVGWEIPKIVCPADRTFRAQIGPGGGKKGYESITGYFSWGVAWYIDGILIPEITVQRGKTYTFIVEGGYDPENSARQHPLYITDDPEGGFEHKSLAEKKKTGVYGGVVRDRKGNYSPTAVGRMCEYKLPSDLSADDFDTFEEFQQNLEMKCDRGIQGRLVFKPDASTPDIVYYQCYTHRYLGWKINVVDSCTENSGGLEYGASVSHVKNITLNNLQAKSESDYKRGPVKQKLSDLQDADPYVYKPVQSGNDGIPLDLYADEDEDFSKPEYIPTYTNLPYTEYTTKKNIYYTPSTKHTVATKKQYYSYPSTTQSSPKLIYYPTATSRPYSQSTKRPLIVSHAVSADTTITRKKQPQQAYSIRHYTLGSSADGPTKPLSYDYSISHLPRQQSRAKPTTKRPSTKPSALRVVMYTSTSSPRKRTTRFENPWWKPIKEQANFANAGNRQKAVQSLRTQLTAIQGNSAPASINQKRPTAINFQNGFLPIVIKNNGSFDRAAVNIPHSIPLHQIAKLASSTNHVPVLVNTRSESVRRENAKPKTKGFIKTPVGNFPFPVTTDKRKGPGVQSKEAFSAFLPLLLPKGKVDDKSTGAAASTKSSSAGIPIVVPEKKGNNLYILHHVLSLITDDSTKNGKTIKVVHAGQGNANFVRPRRARSADHHSDHRKKGTRHNDDHKHNHQHKKSKSGCTMFTPSLLCFVTGIALLLLI